MKEGIRQNAMMRHILIAIASILLAMGLCLTIGSHEAYAATPQSGTITANGSNLTWHITGTGELIIGQNGQKQVLNTRMPDSGSGSGSGSGLDFGWKDPVVNGKETASRATLDPDLDRQNMQDATDKTISERKKWPWFADEDDGINKTITSVEVVGDVEIHGPLAYIFCNMVNVESITGLEHFIMTDVTSLRTLFCANLIWDGVSDYPRGGTDDKPNNWMYPGCQKLTVLSGYEDWDVSSVIEMHRTFAGLYGIEQFDLSKYKTPALRSCNSMFMSSNKAKKIKFGPGFDTSNVLSMHGVFAGCRSLETIEGLEYFDTKEVVTWVICLIIVRI